MIKGDNVNKLVTSTRNVDDFYEVLTTPALSHDYIFEQDIFGVYTQPFVLFFFSFIRIYRLVFFFYVNDQIND